MLTIKEFKAWFDGFIHCVDEAPTKEQWMTVRKKMAEIDSEDVRYVPFPVYPYVSQPIRYGTVLCGTTIGSTQTLTN